MPAQGEVQVGRFSSLGSAASFMFDSYLDMEVWLAFLTPEPHLSQYDTSTEGRGLGFLPLGIYPSCLNTTSLDLLRTRQPK